MNYKKQILSDLLERYESSEYFRTGEGKRRIFLSRKCYARLNDRMEQADEKQEILTCLEELSALGLLSYSWIKHEEGNLIDRIWLNTDQESIRQSYRISGKPDGRKQIQDLSDQLCRAIDQLPEGVIRLFLADQLAWIMEKQKVPRYFTGNQKEDAYLIDSLIFLGRNDGADFVRASETAQRRNRVSDNLSQEKTIALRGEISERILSSRLYGDSKIFERQVRSRLLSCLRSIEKKEDEEALKDDELLQKFGIVRWPEIMELCGPLIGVLDDGRKIDFSSSIYGAYLNSETVYHLKTIHLPGIRRVLFIENKANYVWYLREKKKEDELVVFHGGFFSPAKGNLFYKLYQGGSEVETWEHWSDIDLGGFRIFHRLKTQLIPEVLPYHMDAETLQRMEAQCMPIHEKAYLDRLEKLLDDPEYGIFHDAIRYMLTKKIRLEQEQFLV